MRERLLKVARDLFSQEVTYDLTIDDIPEWDSLGHLNLFMALEQEFKIKFSSEEIIDNDSIKKIDTLLQKKVGEAK